MDKIQKAIEEHRPSLSASSLKVYLTNLNKLKNAIDKDGKGITFLRKREEVIEYLQKLRVATQQTYLIAIRNALLALNEKGKMDKLLEFYYNKFLNNKKMIDEERNKNEKTEKQEKNWATMDELRDVMNEYGKKIKADGLAKKTELNKKEMELLQKWLVANLYLHDENPPIRLDYSPMTVISEGELEDAPKDQNYLVVKSRNRKYFIFNDFKTKKSQGAKEIKVGSKLNSALNLWLKHNKSGSLLLNGSGKPMSSNHLSKYIMSVFAPTGKKIGASMLRHIYISEKFEPQKKEKEDVADKMMHSVAEQSVYAKDD
jgi:hypothetical protein